ncbi:MAG: hypothetical protein GY722_17860 [bacterium]|nr:hypothetical protein [bacterium]
MAEVEDTSEEANKEPGPTKIHFRVSIERGENCRYRVRVWVHDVEGPNPAPVPACTPEGNPVCCLSAGLTWPSTANATTLYKIQFTDDDILRPENGMLTGEVRMLTARALDLDYATLRCGEDPTCMSNATPLPSLPDGLEYEWEVEVGWGEFVNHIPGDPKTARGQSVAFRAHGDLGGEVRIKCTVRDTYEDSTAPWAVPLKEHFPDPSVASEFTIRVYDFRFIDFENHKLKRYLGESGGIKFPVLEVSEEITDRVIAPAATATYDGPAQEMGQVSPDIYRVQVEKIPDDAGEPSFKLIRFADNQQVAAFDQEAIADPEPSDPTEVDWRSKAHTRLVSNDRGPGSATDATYDNEILGDQTILVELGERIEAHFLLDDEFVGKISLPVGRPPCEFGDPDSRSDKVILTGYLRFVELDYGHGWTQGLDEQWAMKRLNEDHMQAGVRWRLAAPTQTVVPSGNAIRVATVLGHGQFPTDDGGGLRFTVNVPAAPPAPPGTMNGYQVTCRYEREETSETIANRPRTRAIDAGLTGTTVVDNSRYPPQSPGYAKIVIFQKGVQGITITDYVHTGDTGSPVVRGNLLATPVRGMANYTDDINRLEMRVLAENFCDDPDILTVRVIVTPRRPGGGDPNVTFNGSAFAIAADARLTESYYGADRNTIGIPSIAVDYLDDTWGTAFGHEAAHILRNGASPPHQTDTWRILYSKPPGDEGAGLPENEEVYGTSEHVDYPKRFQNNDLTVRSRTGPGTNWPVLKADW